MAAISSIGTVLQVSISSVLTTIVGIRGVKWNPGKVETFENDDLDDVYVGVDVTGRIGAGTVTAQMFVDPLAATYVALINLWKTPAKEDFAIEWSDSGTTTYPFVGILTDLPIDAERGDALMGDIEIAVAEKPVIPVS